MFFQGLLLRPCMLDETAATSKKHCKNQYETRFGGPAHRSKFEQKFVETGLEERSVPQPGLVNDPGCSEESAETRLERSWDVLNASWGATGRSWAARDAPR